MSGILLDTHVWAWSLTDDARLSVNGLAAIQSPENIFLSPISFFEIALKVKKGKWPEMQPFYSLLRETFLGQGGRFAPLDPEICVRAAGLEWSHRDPFDRMLAATALENRLSFVSADAAFDALAEMKEWQGRVW